MGVIDPTTDFPVFHYSGIRSDLVVPSALASDIQHRLSLHAATTTDASTINLVRIAPFNSGYIYCDICVSGRVANSNADYFITHIRFGIFKTSTGTVTIRGTTIDFEDKIGVLANSLTDIVSDSGEAQIRVTGLAGTTINWQCRFTNDVMASLT